MYSLPEYQNSAKFIYYLLSGLNNLEDITLDKTFSVMCGYSQNELETVFADYLEKVDLAQVKLWYNGYNWLGQEVYYPFDILHRNVVSFEWEKVSSAKDASWI